MCTGAAACTVGQGGAWQLPRENRQICGAPHSEAEIRGSISSTAQTTAQELLHHKNQLQLAKVSSALLRAPIVHHAATRRHTVKMHKKICRNYSHIYCPIEVYQPWTCTNHLEKLRGPKGHWHTIANKWWQTECWRGYRWSIPKRFRAQKLCLLWRGQVLTQNAWKGQTRRVVINALAHSCCKIQANPVD